MCIKEKKKNQVPFISGPKITGAKDTHERDGERETERERGMRREAREHRGQREIIIIIEVVFQGQYLRFFLIVSLEPIE